MEEEEIVGEKEFTVDDWSYEELRQSIATFKVGNKPCKEGGEFPFSAAVVAAKEREAVKARGARKVEVKPKREDYEDLEEISYYDANARLKPNQYEQPRQPVNPPPQ